MLNVRVAPTPDALFRMAADELGRIATDAASGRGVCHIALSGGSTPKALYALLATPLYRGSIPWTRTHLFWSDERHVPPDSSQSNYGVAREALLRHVPVPASNVHRIRGELSVAGSAASQYEDALWQTLKPTAGRPPKLMPSAWEWARMVTPRRSSLAAQRSARSPDGWLRPLWKSSVLIE